MLKFPFSIFSYIILVSLLAKYNEKQVVGVFFLFLYHSVNFETHFDDYETLRKLYDLYH